MPSLRSEYWGFIKDPIYGYIRIKETEKRILDTQPVQRMRRIKQLAGAEYVYPAANHTRFEHMLGTMHLAGVLAENISCDLIREDIDKLKIAALLHDVGHAPFSHLFEPLLVKYLAKTHEDMTMWIIKDSELADVLSGEGFNPDEIGRLAVGRLEDDEKPFLDQVIRGSVDVDKMDFIVRDSYHTGAGYGHVDVFRLIYTLDILNGNLAVNVTALPTLEMFILARLESFRTIYFHRTSRSIQIMLLKALEQAKEELNISTFKSPEEFLSLDDYVVWSMLRKSEKSKDIIIDLERRNLLKCAYERTFFVRDELISSVIANETIRRQIEEEIAKKARINVDDITIDVPSLPSVPYHYAFGTETMDIPAFCETKSGEKTSQKLTELSRIIDGLQVFMNIIRVYTKRPYRERVAKVAEDILGKTPIMGRISF